MRRTDLARRSARADASSSDTHLVPLASANSGRRRGELSAPLLEPPPVHAVLQEVVPPASPSAAVALGASWSPLEADPPSSSFTPLTGEAGCPSYFIQVSPRQKRLQRRGQRLLLAQIRSGVPSPDQDGFQAAVLAAFG